MSLTVVKMGGSSITFKDKPFSINEEGINNIAEALSEAGMRYFLITEGDRGDTP